MILSNVFLLLLGTAVFGGEEINAKIKGKVYSFCSKRISKKFKE